MAVDTDQTKEIFDLMYEVRDRTTRIEAKTDRIGYIEKKTDEADDKANEALLKANINEKELDKTQNNIKWTWGFVATVVLGVLGLAAKILV